MSGARAAKSVLALAFALALVPRALAAPTVDAALALFRAEHGAAWTLELDALTGRPRRLAGGAVTWLGPDAATRSDSAAELLREAGALFDEHADLLGVEPETLRLSEDGVIDVQRGRLHVLHFDVAPHGVPVLGARVTVVVRSGSLVYVHLVGTAPVTADPVPLTDLDVAFRRALDAAGVSPRQLEPSAPPDLCFVPQGASHRLAWRVVLRERDRVRRQVVLIDARTGELVALTDETVSCDPPPPAGTARRVLAGVRPRRADEAERVELLPFAEVDGRPAGADGFFTAPAPPYSGRLVGPAVQVECIGCADPPVPAAPGSAGGDVDFGRGGADADGNGFATPADRCAYFHVESVRRQASRWLALPYLDHAVHVRTNEPQACNAYWDGSSLTFFRSSARCANTGEIRDVVAHEWGHGLDENDGLAPSSLSVDAATGEAVGDIVALLRSRDACIGESFFLDPGDFPSAACSGVRDLDERAAGHEHGNPATLTTDNVSAKCARSAFYRGPAGAEGHCEGEIFGQAFWHLVQDLRTGTSYATGDPLGMAPLSDEAAWQLAEQLFYDSRSALASYAPSALQSIGTSAYDAFLLADDEGDGLANGTPHAAAIHDAFAHHGLAEQGAPPATGSPCVPPGQPVLAATRTSDPASGLPAIGLAWSDVGAAAYHLLRADDPGDAFLPLAPPLPAGTTSFTDRGVLPARTYRYRVVAEDATGCLSAAAAPVVAGPGAVLRIASVRIDDSIGGDGNGLLSPGETADVRVDVANDGTVAATGLQVVLSSTDPGLVVLAGGPLAYGTVGAGLTVLGPAPFRVRAEATAPLSVFLRATGAAVEGCLGADWLLAIARPELVIVSSTLDDSAGGNGDGAWQPGETIDLDVLLRNDGVLDAASVDGTLSFRGTPVPGVTLQRSDAGWGDVSSGASRPCAPPHLALQADSALGPRTRVPLSLELRIAGAVHARRNVDLVVGGFPPGQLEWSRVDNVYPGAPLVLQLTDDDGNGVVDGCDTPDVVVVGYTRSRRTLVALSGDGGRFLWECTDPCTNVGYFSALAGGDIDGDGRAEILAADGYGYVCAVTSDGSVLWRTAAPVQADQAVSPPRRAVAPEVWDLDGDGHAEVVAGFSVLDGRDGSVRWEHAENPRGAVLVGDLDLDGRLEVTGGNLGLDQPAWTWRADGTAYPVTFPGFLWGGGLVNLDRDASPEVVWVNSWADVCAAEHDGSPVFGPVDVGDASTAGSLTPCFADFDGDGLAEIVAPAGPLLTVLGSDGSVRWTSPIRGGWFDGCSVFDFDEDGSPEIVYRDQDALRVYDGRDGTVLWETPIAAWREWFMEHPVIADVDGDGSAEILVVNEDGGYPSTLRVFGNPSWAPARKIWNQIDYSVTHVDDDGGIPAHPSPWWISPGLMSGQVSACTCNDTSISVTQAVACGSTTACLQATATGGVAPLVVTWDFLDGSPRRTGDQACHDYGAPGAHSVLVTVEDGAGCSTQRAEVVLVHEPLSAAFGPDVACLGTTCFEADASTGSPPLEFSWDFGDGTPLESGATSCHAFGEGTATVTLSVRDAAGCMAQNLRSFEIGRVPASIGTDLRATGHGNPRAALIQATFAWAGARPLAPGETFVISRGTQPTALARVAGTEGWTATTWVDSTPAAAPEALPFVHFYDVRVQDACGSVSEQ